MSYIHTRTLQVSITPSNYNGTCVLSSKMMNTKSPYPQITSNHLRSSLHEPIPFLTRHHDSQRFPYWPSPQDCSSTTKIGWHTCPLCKSYLHHSWCHQHWSGLNGGGRGSLHSLDLYSATLYAKFPVHTASTWFQLWRSIKTLRQLAHRPRSKREGDCKFHSLHIPLHLEQYYML